MRLKIFIDNMCFEETMTEFSNSLSNIGFKHDIIYILDSWDEKKEWNNTIYFCFGMNDWMNLSSLPPRFIVMQMEPLCIRGVSENYITIMQRSLAVFEYSRHNRMILNEHKIPKNKIYMISVGFSESKINIVKTEKDIDVLFIGSLSMYRKYKLENLKSRMADLNIQYVDSCWGQQRDTLLKRSKIVLNIHSEDCKKFPLEVPRFLIYARYFNVIISETSGDINEEKRWSGIVEFNDDLERCIRKKLADSRFEMPQMIRCVPLFSHSTIDFLKKNKFNVTFSPSETHMKWYDVNTCYFDKVQIDADDAPDISNVSDDTLPCVSIITLTTISRLKKWMYLMRWNTDNRKYPKEKIQWIVVIDRSDNQEENRRVQNDIRNISPELNIVIILYSVHKSKKIPQQVTEKRNIALEYCVHEYIDVMDDDDIEIPDALKIKIVYMMHHKKMCIGTKDLVCYSLKEKSMFIKKGLFPTESTLTFHRDYLKKSRFSCSIHGEGSLMVLSQMNDTMLIDGVLNMIAITHSGNITSNCRAIDNKTIGDNNLLCKFVDHEENSVCCKTLLDTLNNIK